MSNEFQFLIYKSAEEDVSVDAFIQNETIWITANQMAVLFDKSESTIRKHINNVFDEGELDRENNTQKVRVDGVKQPVAFYNLDTIISVGYRVNSRRATQFRIWATSVLKEYMIKGFAMDDERLKQGKTSFGKDYFRELLERVRSIRASELQIFLRNAALTMIEMHRSPMIFMPWCRISSILQSPGRRQRKSSTLLLTGQRKIWD